MVSCLCLHNSVLMIGVNQILRDTEFIVQIQAVNVIEMSNEHDNNMTKCWATLFAYKFSYKLTDNFQQQNLDEIEPLASAL